MFFCRTEVIKINLNGGLGNQLFQFAVATNLALIEGKQLIFAEDNKIWKNRLGFLGINIGDYYSPKVINSILSFSESPKDSHGLFCKYEKYNEPSFHYSKISTNHTHTSVHGYFQSEKYFEDYRDEIKKFIKDILDNKCFHSQSENIIQIRMGDMARSPDVRKVHGIVSDSYLKKALDLFSIEIGSWLQISDDAEMIKYELPNFEELKIKGHTSQSDLEDLFLLSEAKNLIISNSTFGWWGAFLSQGKVVAPIRWFTELGMQTKNSKDLFPKNWILI